MHAFIIRPFNIKKDIDFERVDAELISPALDALGIKGRTTSEILKQGNIRLDMFQRLLTADLVVADVSIHNANVFYELGIRHALREKRTFLLRCEADDYPFDLRTDRYLVYDKNNPAASLAKLIAALQQTLDSRDQDSPVFQHLPDLQAQDLSRFLPVPRDFREEVEVAVNEKRPGDLGLLATEAGSFQWSIEGLRVIGREQLRLKLYRAAKETWEAVREQEPDDVDANTWLGTIYERLGDLTRSDQAVLRVLAREGVGTKKRAEALSLAARNAKTRWKAEWQREELSLEKRREKALRSRFLEDSYKTYWKAFEEDLGHFYPGLNALAMLVVLVDLATGLPGVWADRFDRAAEAKTELKQLRERAGKLAAAVEVCLEANRDRLERENRSDIWLDISEADLCSLTSKRPSRVADAYRRALAKASAFDLDAARQQLNMYQDLDLLRDNVKAALEVIPAIEKQKVEKEKVLLFTGHRIDSTDRKEPRFPADKEGVAREEIRKEIQKERGLSPIAYGLAGGASGGDILFHEVCAELEIPTRLYLALPPEKYVVESVRDSGPDWVERFNRLVDRHKDFRKLADSKVLPHWLRSMPESYFWQRNNLWMLHNALADEGKDLTLIALWDGKDQGDGPGGTADLVRRAKERGAKFLHIDTRKLFGFE